MSEVTLAVSLIVVPFLACTVTSIEALEDWPFCRVPRPHTTFPVLPAAGVVQLPWLVLALTKVVPVGTASLTTTPVASSGPRLSARGGRFA